MVTPYFLSKPFTLAITTEAQSVRGMKPTFTSFFSGASEPAAQALARIIGLIVATTAAVLVRKWRRVCLLRMSWLPCSCVSVNNEGGAVALLTRVGRLCRFRRPSLAGNPRSVQQAVCQYRLTFSGC